MAWGAGEPGGALAAELPGQPLSPHRAAPAAWAPAAPDGMKSLTGGPLTRRPRGVLNASNLRLAAAPPRPNRTAAPPSVAERLRRRRRRSPCGAPRQASCTCGAGGAALTGEARHPAGMDICEVAPARLPIFESESNPAIATHAEETHNEAKSGAGASSVAVRSHAYV